MKYFGIGFDAVIIRFYLMMFIVIAAVVTGVYWVAILALPVFLSCMLGIQFSKMKLMSGSNMHSAHTALRVD